MKQDATGQTAGRTQGGETEPADQQSALIAPDFTTTLTNGDTFTLSEQRGKVVVVNFWATWCGPCVGEMPAFEQLQSDYGDKIVVIGVNCGESETKIKTFAERHGYTYLMAADEDYAVSSLYPTEGIPYTVVVDQEGNIVCEQLGAGEAEAMYAMYKEKIDGLL